MKQFEGLDVTEDEISLSEIFEAVKPFILHILIITLVMGILGFGYTKLFVKPVYQSSATLIVNNRKDDSGAISNDEINSAKGLASVYSIIIKSDAVMQPVVNLIDQSMSANKLADKVSVSSVNGTQIIKVSVNDRDPMKAQRYVDEILKVAPGVIEEMVEAGSVKVVSQPTAPKSPISPNVKINTLMAAMLGFVLSLGAVLAVFFFDNTFRTPEEIEKYLDLPVIGVIPNVESVSKGGSYNA